MKNALTALALLVASCASNSATPVTNTTATITPAIGVEFDAAIAQGMERVGAPGLAVAVYTEHGVYMRGFGVTDVDTREPTTADTAFYIASSTKALTGLAFSILDQRGTLSLNTTLSTYAPDAPFPAAVRPNEVTFRNLLTHTHGIDNGGIGWRLAYSGEHDPETLWRVLGASTEKTAAPLGTFEYTNVGFNIATILTDRRMGVAWQDLLQREIFDPAGMTHASARISRAEAAHWPLAEPHVAALETSGSERIHVRKTDATMQSAGGVVMSANDAARWLELMVEDGRIGGQQVIPAAAVRETRVSAANLDQEDEGYKSQHYGLGWYIGPYQGDTMLHDFGAFVGFRTHVSYIPARHVGVAVFINDSSLSAPFVDVVANYIYDRLASRPDARASYDAAVNALVARMAQGRTRALADRANRTTRPWTLSHPRNAYAGVYENPAFGTITINVAGDMMTATNGILSVVASSYTRPDTIRVELAPGAGQVIGFEFTDGPNPSALIFGGGRFTRRS